MNTPATTLSLTTTSSRTKLWNPTKVQHLVRHKSGIYYARLKRGGKDVWKSLKTASLEIARRRLTALLAETSTRATAPASAGSARTAGAVSVIMLRNVALDPSRKQSTKECWEDLVQSLWNTWPELKTCEVSRITPEACLAWASRYAAKYSATRFNGALTALRHIIQTGVSLGLRSDDPTKELKRLRPKNKDLGSRLPTLENFRAWVAAMRAAPRRNSAQSADVVEFLAYSGLRISEAHYIRWMDWDQARRQLVVVGDPVHGTKNRQVRRIDLIPAMQALMERLRSTREDEPEDTPVLTLKDARNAMSREAAKLGIPRLTHHDLRHLFATLCIESGVDIPTVSRWLGHRDGGALAMRVYGHLRNEHSAAAAARVNFGS